MLYVWFNIYTYGFKNLTEAVNAKWKGFILHVYLNLCLSLCQVEGVGKYFQEQLLQSRHRGAFELAYVGFVRLTEMLCRWEI